MQRWEENLQPWDSDFPGTGGEHGSLIVSEAATGILILQEWEWEFVILIIPLGDQKEEPGIFIFPREEGVWDSDTTQWREDSLQFWYSTGIGREAYNYGTP